MLTSSSQCVGRGRLGCDARNKVLPDALVEDYVDKFYGFGTWNAKTWLIGIEEAGGWTEHNIHQRLEVWKQNGSRDLEDAPIFYPASGNPGWHGASASIQFTWNQLIRMLLVGRGKGDSEAGILTYQRDRFGQFGGNECILELLPLPSPSTSDWKYGEWSNLRWLKSRNGYQNYVLLNRALALQKRIEEHKPKVVIFYASTWHRLWGLIARGVWTQAIPGKLMTVEHDDISFYVTRHPRSETDDYFRQIGVFLKRKHGRKD
jgi:hypothetical protein